MCPDCVFGIAPQRLDDDVLLDSLEEDLYLPSVAVDVRHLQRADVEVVGDKAKHLSAVGISVLHQTDRFGVKLGGFHPRQPDSAVAEQPVSWPKRRWRNWL